MKIGLQTWGTEGDIRPFIALSAGLSRAGHEVTLAVTEIRNTSYSHFGDAFGFRMIHTGKIDVSEDQFSSLGRRIVRSHSPALKSRLLIDNFLNPVLPEMYETSRELSSTCEAVVGHLFVYPLKVAAMKQGIPWISLYTTPLLPSADISPPGFPGFAPLLGWRAFDAAMNLLWKPDMNAFYRREGLRKPASVLNDVFFSRDLNLVSVSPSIYPFSVSRDYNFCGAFCIPSDGNKAAVDPDLLRFLAHREKPVYITFGSMYFGEQHPEELLKLLLKAVELAGCRAVVQAAGAVTDSVSSGENIYFTERTDHGSVFPECAAVIHHGGCGTSHSACAAGIPSVVVEYTADQPLWGRALMRVGAAPDMLHRRSLSAQELAESIEKVLHDPFYRENARTLSEKMKMENGVSTAISLIEEKYMS